MASLRCVATTVCVHVTAGYPIHPTLRLLPMAGPLQATLVAELEAELAALVGTREAEAQRAQQALESQVAARFTGLDKALDGKVGWQ